MITNLVCMCSCVCCRVWCTITWAASVWRRKPSWTPSRWTPSITTHVPAHRPHHALTPRGILVLFLIHPPSLLLPAPSQYTPPLKSLLGRSGFVLSIIL
ncbi:hypothetical protein E2C01_066428 [Portunus trituberculatus]|uniref:Secreted protein n=1 Tax=Portunus trituberculatus TaxID=210409 RepID=A0A5B7HUN0_PORTR|nr:hypothetical protein [Portunus trituberculatus]